MHLGQQQRMIQMIEILLPIEETNEVVGFWIVDEAPGSMFVLVQLWSLKPFEESTSKCKILSVCL